MAAYGKDSRGYSQTRKSIRGGEITGVPVRITQGIAPQHTRVAFLTALSQFGEVVYCSKPPYSGIPGEDYVNIGFADKESAEECYGALKRGQLEVDGIVVGVGNLDDTENKHSASKARGARAGGVRWGDDDSDHDDAVSSPGSPGGKKNRSRKKKKKERKSTAEQQEEGLKHAMQGLDMTGEGHISRDLVESVFRTLGNWKDEELGEILDQFGKYTIDVEDFTHWVMDGVDDDEIEKVVKDNYEAVVIVEESKLRSSKPDPGQELCDCAGHGHLDHMREILANGTDVNTKALRSGDIALHSAASRGRLDALRELLEKDADIDAKNKKGQTPLMAAARGGHVDCIAELLGHDASIDIQDDHGGTALMEAAQWGKLYCVKCLVEHDADGTMEYSQGNWEGKTAVEVAQEKKYSSIVKVLK